MTEEDIDIAILLDITNSITPQDIEEKQNFTIEFISSILAARPNANIRLFTMGVRTYFEFYINGSSNSDMVSEAIKNVRLKPGTEDLTTAILYTLINGFQEIVVDRECVPNYLVIITNTPIGNSDLAEMLRRVLEFKNVHAVVLNMADNQTDFENAWNSSFNTSTAYGSYNSTTTANVTDQVVLKAEKDFIAITTDKSHVVTLFNESELQLQVEFIASVVLSGNMLFPFIKWMNFNFFLLCVDYKAVPLNRVA